MLSYAQTKAYVDIPAQECIPEHVSTDHDHIYFPEAYVQELAFSQLVPSHIRSQG